MASRKKPVPAELQTVGLFTGTTALEEAELLVREETSPERPVGPRDLPAEHVATALHWLNLDNGESAGEDVRLALHPMGHGLLQLIGKNKSSVRELLLSKRQVQRLVEVVRAL